MTNKTTFDGKAAWVTGAGGGIGRECARAFAQSGAAVAVIDRNQAGIDETLSLVQQDGGRGLAICADVTDERDVAEAFKRALDALGRIDFGVNNAGISQTPAPTADIGYEEWTRVLLVNVTGTWLCMREQLRHMSKLRSGVIVNTASFAGLRSLPGNSAYVTSKHAVVGLTKNAAVEYAPLGIRINAIAPGGIQTPMMDRSLDGLDSTQRVAALESIANLHSMKRIGTPDEIADGILFLCSAQASFITGVCLSVDGGWAAS